MALKKMTISTLNILIAELSGKRSREPKGSWRYVRLTRQINAIMDIIRFGMGRSGKTIPHKDQ